MNPSSWAQAEACGCRACRAIVEIRQRCDELQEPLFVCDCRMWGRGFQVGDIRKLFVSPATDGVAHRTAEDAAARVFETQQHCDIYLSSWPMRPDGSMDFYWRRWQVLRAIASTAAAE